MISASSFAGSSSGVVRAARGWGLVVDMLWDHLARYTSC
jgi:hypothetical protein